MNIRMTAMAMTGALALAGCSTGPVVERGIISDKTRALLPYKQDLNQIVRATDGCYFEVMEGSTSGYLSPVQNPYHEGQRVCDAVTTQ